MAWLLPDLISGPFRNGLFVVFALAAGLAAALAAALAVLAALASALRGTRNVPVPADPD